MTPGGKMGPPRKAESELERMYAKQFAQVLKSMREDYGFSQYELAQRVGIDPSIMSRMESEERSPSRNVVERIIEGLEMASWDANKLRLAGGFAPIKRIDAPTALDVDPQRGELEEMPV